MRPLIFVGVQGGGREKDGLHVCVASIEVVKPTVGDHLQRNVEERA